jgi:hypothetical protein
MATGSVNPFTPNGPTQTMSVTSSSSAVTVPPCDAVLVYNGGTVDCFVAIAASDQTAPTAVTSTSMPVPKGTRQLVGMPGVAGSNQVTQLAAVATSATTLYVTPGVGTEY